MLLASCGQTPVVSLAVDNAAPELLRGADVQVEVTLTRTGGASADVALAVTGLPANVDAAFSPATLSGATLTSTLTLSAQPGATAGDYLLGITATGAGLSTSADLTLEVVSLTVNGRLTTLFDQPMTGVAVGSQGDTELTGADGSFTLSGLSVPYDIAAWHQVDEWVHVFEGLSANEIELSTLPTAGIPVATFGTTVQGSLGAAVAPNHEVYVCAEGLDGFLAECDIVAPAESTYSISADWFDTPTLQVRLYALGVQYDVGGKPVAYPGYKSFEIPLADGTPVMADVTDLGAALATTTLAIDVVSSAVIGQTTAGVQVGPGLFLPVFRDTSGAATLAAVLPVIPDATYSVTTMGTFLNFAWHADITGDAVTVTLPDPPTLLSPADAATGVTTSTMFEVGGWTAGPVSYVWSPNAPGPQVMLTTMDTSATIPELSDFGLSLPASTS